MSPTPDVPQTSKPGSTASLMDMVSTAINAVDQAGLQRDFNLYGSCALHEQWKNAPDYLRSLIFHETSPLSYHPTRLAGYFEPESIRKKPLDILLVGLPRSAESSFRYIVDEFLCTTKVEHWMGESLSTSTLAFQRIPFSTGMNSWTLLDPCASPRTSSPVCESGVLVYKPYLLSELSCPTTKRTLLDYIRVCTSGSTLTERVFMGGRRCGRSSCGTLPKSNS